LPFQESQRTGVQKIYSDSLQQPVHKLRALKNDPAQLPTQNNHVKSLSSNIIIPDESTSQDILMFSSPVSPLEVASPAEDAPALWTAQSSPQLLQHF
jgi:hypothetical protein